MCGIIGIIAKNEDNIIPSIIKGLKNLEYRGYDSAGIAGLVNNDLATIKAEGKIYFLEQELLKHEFKTHIAIGHTRWATHGAANKTNAHPHQTEKASVVHNGIIENFLHIKEELVKLGYQFFSETDSEVIPNLITYYLDQGFTPLAAVQKTIKRLEGAFSIAVIFPNNPEFVIAARKGSPLVIGCAENKMVVASDSYALAFLTNKIVYLEEGDIALIYNDKLEIYNSGHLVNRNFFIIDNISANLSKGNFRHYMLKEIFEQPSILANTIKAYYDLNSEELNFPNLDLDFQNISKISLVACGTSYYASMLAKYWLEMLIDIPIEVEIASEFRYRNTYLPENGLSIFLSQSGETADTIAALKHAKQKGQKTIAIINVKESSLNRMADHSLQCFAGPEISVASTKGFTTQLVVLLLFSLYLAYKRGNLDKISLNKNLKLVAEIPGRIAEVLGSSDQIKNIAREIANAKSSVFIGRNSIYPIALEGALKLKELSYIHAEAIAAGELKHGPIALIDENVPIVALAPKNHLFEKINSNIQEIAAREGKIITFSSSEGNGILKGISKHQINISAANQLIEPIIYAIPMQLLAYHVAVMKGTDVDQPRNLAKSVTVE